MYSSEESERIRTQNLVLAVLSRLDQRQIQAFRDLRGVELTREELDAIWGARSDI